MSLFRWGRRGSDRMAVGFITFYAISTITTIVVSINPSEARCTRYNIKVCQWLETGRCFSFCTPISSTNKTDRHDITEILLKVALNTITPISLSFWSKTNFYVYVFHKISIYILHPLIFAIVLVNFVCIL